MSPVEHTPLRAGLDPPRGEAPARARTAGAAPGPAPPTAERAAVKLRVPTGPVIAVLSAVAAFFVLVNLASLLTGVAFGPQRRLFHLVNLDYEQNLPTLFASLLLFLCALALAARTVLARREGSRWSRHWGALAAIFLVLALDESLRIHERVGEAFPGLLGVDVPLFPEWVLTYAPLTLLAAALYARFLLARRARTRALFVAAGALYVTGAIGFEVLVYPTFETAGKQNLAYGLLATAEETLEMAGAILFLHALLLTLRERSTELRLRLTR